MSRRVLLSLAAIAVLGSSALIVSAIAADAKSGGVYRGAGVPAARASVGRVSVNRVSRVSANRVSVKRVSVNRVALGRIGIFRRPLPSSIATRRISGGASCPPGQFCRPDAARPNHPSAKVPPFTPPPAATIPPRRPAIPPMAKLGTRPSGTTASTNVQGPHRCQQVCRPIVVGRRCAEARGEYNPRTGSGTASHCTRWEPITQTLCERQCTSGGVYYWR
jgi:hypothetical protein